MSEQMAPTPQEPPPDALAERDMQIHMLQNDLAILREELAVLRGGIGGAIAAKIHDLDRSDVFLLLLGVLILLQTVVPHVH